MQIGELSRRTQVPARLLRYYEEQGLLTPERGENGYRSYPDYAVDRVLQIRGLLESGLPTRIIKDILPCLDSPRTIHMRDVTPEMLATLERERDQLDRRIACLTRNRHAITAYLAAVHRAPVRRGSATPSSTTTSRTTLKTSTTAGATTAGAATAAAAAAGKATATATRTKRPSSRATHAGSGRRAR